MWLIEQEEEEKKELGELHHDDMIGEKIEEEESLLIKQ